MKFYCKSQIEDGPECTIQCDHCEKYFAPLQVTKPEDYINHSGGAQGADLEWDRIGREFGVTEHIHWRPKHLRGLSEEAQQQVVDAVESAARVLVRPTHFVGIEWVQRNWIPTHHAHAIYAISYILVPGQKDLRGLPNASNKEVVAGGTGWAVEMAIQMGKPVFVYDMNSNTWCQWDYEKNKFVLCFIPKLTKIFSGIGARNLTLYGTNAIRSVYQKTFKL